MFLPNQIAQAKEVHSLSLDANAVLATDIETGRIFYQKNADQPVPIASLTKLISIYIVKEEIAKGMLAPEDTVEISQAIATLSTVENLSNVPLEAGQKYTVNELIEAALLPSANAAVMALAEKISGNQIDFVKRMNTLLEHWGITSATIINASGLNNEYLGDFIYPGTEKNAENKMSARDIAIVARHLINDFPEITEITSQSSSQFGEYLPQKIEITNTNLMLPQFHFSEEGMIGLKTGTTDLAGACFVGLVERNGQKLLTVILGAPSDSEKWGARFTETQKLINYVYKTWEKKKVVQKDKVYATLPVRFGKKDNVPLIATQSFTTWVSKTSDNQTISLNVKQINAENSIPEQLAPIQKNHSYRSLTLTVLDPLNYLELTDVNQINQQKIDLVAEQSVEKISDFEIFKIKTKEWVINTIEKIKSRFT